MGVAGLWAELEPSQTTTTFTALALTKLDSPSRGFRIGIDASIWFFHAEYGKEGENPELRTLFFRCAQLTNHGLLPLFVFDGPKRPDFKRGKRICKSSHKLVSGMKGILDAFGFEYRTAPGEAEAELAFLNRIGVIDGVLSDDVDNFLFGARTVIRNHSSTHPTAAASSSLEKSKVVVYTLPHPDLPNFEPADIIFIALCSGGDYDATGIPSCGIKIASGLARAGFGKSLYQAATTMDKESQELRNFLRDWRIGIAHELTTNSSGFLPMKKPSIAKKIPDTFPDIEVLFSYVSPVTSETLGRLDLYDDLIVGHNQANGWLKKDPSLPQLASSCELHFEWGVMDTIIKRFRTVIFRGVVLRILRRAILVKDNDRHSQGSCVALDAKFIKEHFSFFGNAHGEYATELPGESYPLLASKIHSTRTHPSTSKTPEYRLEIDPTILVKLTANGVKGIRKVDANEWAYLDEEEEEASDNDSGKTPGGSQKVHDPYEKLRVWIAADLMRCALPTLVDEYEEGRRKKEEKKTKKGTRGTTASPTKSKTRPKANVNVSEPVTSRPLARDDKEGKAETVVPLRSKPGAVKAKAQSAPSLRTTNLASAPVPRNAKSKLLAALDGALLSSDEEIDHVLLGAGISPKPPKPSKPPHLTRWFSGDPEYEASNPAPSETAMKALVKGSSKRGTRTGVSTKTKKSHTNDNGINSFYNVQKARALDPTTTSGKGKGKATAPSAAQRYIAICNRLDGATDDETAFPDADELFGYFSAKPAPKLTSSPSRPMYPDDDLFRPPAGPPDTPSPRKNPVMVNGRKKNSISSDDGFGFSAEKDKSNKSPRKSSEHTSPGKRFSDGRTRPGGARTIYTITHPSRSRRACSPTPANRDTAPSGVTRAVRKPLPVIDISSSDSESETDGKSTTVLKPAKKVSGLTPLEAARARSRNKTYGNTDSKCTAINAARCLVAFGAPAHVRVYPGASKPLIQPTKHAPEIHGPDGLGGVEGLPSVDDSAVLAHIARDADGTSANALEGMSKHIKETWGNGSGSKVTVISSGPMTNVALFVAVYPELLVAVEEFVFMGGGVGLGNRSAVAEFNIFCDPHAAQMVLDAPVPAVMIPINVTHTAIVTKDIHCQLLSPGSRGLKGNLPPASSNLRYTLSTLISFFAEAYKSTFGFNLGPPLHDALTVAYVAYPMLFRSKRYRVDVELAPSHTIGETVVDVWGYRHSSEDTWGVGGKNCIVTESLDVAAFFDYFLACVARCDAISPLNG
ncbi:hypothetical protein E1B28_004685 [Marasmius oreades]|uniref:Uncharacterized protein n=1 Tax=Marasmius oreades TaxID=181124 RepID=A0A9P7UZ24_9AGAR|nr:uncharacterized protein E1B28_004685 [Marasmius oreades]KAG7097326.1 hypothetical protein E1B28_004685 [Marasmius oreades]